ncbi:hypothetical protein BT93_E1854 [Corymbia citriodora subsp. variegata]|nr:hypothetical protein BT93_E1854 [Corymbia citriodora subsp. variegata]
MGEVKSEAKLASRFATKEDELILSKEEEGKESRKSSNVGPWPAFVRSKPQGGAATSGTSTSPSKHLTTCLIVGLSAGSQFEHSRPNFNIAITSPSLYSPFNLGSTSSRALPSLYLSHTKSTRTSSSGPASWSIGRRPHATSSKNAPKANTSELSLAFPVLGVSGARYPSVPTTRVVPGFDP